MIAAQLNPLLVGTDVPPIPAAQAWVERYGGDHGPLINLAQAVPGSPPPAELLARLGAAAAQAENATYGPILGDVVLREALAGDVRALYGADIAPGDVAITAGCNQAFFVTIMALAKAGDEVILPAPWYFNHKMTLDMLGIVARPLPCREQHGFVPQAADARALLGSKTRAIVLVTPNNPTGAVYPQAVLAEFADLARQTGVPLVLDETYRDFLPEGQGRPHDLFAAPDWRRHLVHLYSFSKSYAVPGHRLGAVIAAPGMVDEIAKILDCLMICPPRAGQAAIAWAVDGTAPWRRRTRAEINARAATFRDVIAGAPGWSIAAIGAYFAYVRHPFDRPGDAVAEDLAQRVGLLTLPGSYFGPGQERHLRVAFANVDEHRLAEVAQRLAAFA